MANGNSEAREWEILQSMPTKRVFSTAVLHKENLYVVGGCDHRGVPLKSFEAYNVGSNQWKVLPSMPTNRAGAAVVAIGNKMIVMGGVDVSQKPLDVVEIFSIDENKWSTGDPMKEPLLGISAVVRDGKVLVVGGMAADGNPRDYFMSFDVEKNVWKSQPVMSEPRYATFSFLINDRLYVIGGRQGKLPVAAFEMFDFKENSWEKLPNIPSKRVFSLYIATDTNIFSIGGLNQKPGEGFSDMCESFNIEKREWFIGAPMPTKRGDFAIGIVKEKVLCAGGLGNTGSPLSVVEAYDHSTNTWTQLSDIPSAHCSCAYTMVNDRLYIIGGLSLQGLSGCMESIGSC